MNKNSKIDAYIKPMLHEENNRRYYKMYFVYNDIEYCYLFQNPEALNVATSFRKVIPNLEGVTYTDQYGLYGNKDTVLGTITELDNIKNSIIHITRACLNSKVPTDLTIHQKGISYDIVRDLDNTKYITNNEKSNGKGYNLEKLQQLLDDIKNIFPLQRVEEKLQNKR